MEDSAVRFSIRNLTPALNEKRGKRVNPACQPSPLLRQNLYILEDICSFERKKSIVLGTLGKERKNTHYLPKFKSKTVYKTAEGSKEASLVVQWLGFACPVQEAKVQILWPRKIPHGGEQPGKQISPIPTRTLLWESREIYATEPM